MHHVNQLPDPSLDLRKMLWVNAFTSIAADNSAQDCATFATEAVAFFDAQFGPEPLLDVRFDLGH
jgi:hypothetical protein